MITKKKPAVVLAQLPAFFLLSATQLSKGVSTQVKMHNLFETFRHVYALQPEASAARKRVVGRFFAFD